MKNCSVWVPNLAFITENTGRGGGGWVLEAEQEGRYLDLRVVK
jgi:hypothetical protein